MKKAVVAALILTFAAAAAFAQSTGQGAGTTMGPLPQREPNLANPQAHDNRQAQPPLAHQNGDSGQANSIPTPTLGRPMTTTNAQRRP